MVYTLRIFLFKIQFIYYSASSLYIFRVSNTRIVRSTQNFNYSLRYCAATSFQRGHVVQRDATQSSVFIILQVHSTCFGCQPHPSSGEHKTVTTASGTGHIFCAATSLQSGQASLATLEAVVTVLCTPDDGCG